ncbi:Os03g0558600, partial [Oryza sativa Japonica Group]
CHLRRPTGHRRCHLSSVPDSPLHAVASALSDLTSFLGADLWERRPRHGSSGARPHRRQRAAVGSRRCSRRLEANPVELLRHQLRLTILSKTPQESLRTVQRGGRSTTVFSNSDLVPPSSIPVQPIEPSTLTHRRMHGVPSASNCSCCLRRCSHHWLGKS